MNKIKKIFALALIATTMSIPTVANAEWKQNNVGWWYSEGNSWATGWRQINGKWYYFDANGYMKTGWQEIDGYAYYFYVDGCMASNASIDGHMIGSDGRWIKKSSYNKAVSIAEDDAINKALGYEEETTDTSEIEHEYYQQDLY